MKTPIILTLAGSLGLAITDVKVDAINPVIFKTKVLNSGLIQGLTKDGDDFYLINAADNTADLVTAATIKEQAVAGFTAKSPTSLQLQAMHIAEQFGMVKTVNFEGKVDTVCRASILSSASALNMKVSAVALQTQNEVIFKAKVIKGNLISGLTQDEGNYYEIDEKANSATLVNPSIITEKATAALLAGKPNDYVTIAEGFGLITSLTLTQKKKDVEAPQA